MENSNDPSQAYEIIQQIGSGTYGKVYLAKCSESNQIVAIKICKQLDTTVQREINILSKYQHTNLIQLYCYFSVNSSFWIVMEYGGKDLYENIKSSYPYSLTDLKYIIKNILQAIEFLHSKGIIYRDLNPGNILISDEKNVKLVDFGLTKPDEQIPHSPLIGSKSYFAPEIIIHSSSYNKSCDLWSVGCIICSMLIGNNFFKPDNDLELFIQQLKIVGTPSKKDWPEIPDNIQIPHYFSQLGHIFSDINSDLFDLIKRLLTFSPSKRISAYDALHHPFFN